MGLLLNGSSWIMSTTPYNRASTDHTVMYWLRLDNTASTRRPFGHTGAWEARTSGTTLTSDYLQSGTLGTVTLTVGVWHHVAFLQSVSTSQRFAYLDGVLVQTINSATFAGAQNANLSIGVTAGGSGQGWFGGIDDIRVYDHISSAEEIATIHACRGTDGIFEDLSLWYQLKEGVQGATVAETIYNTGMDGASAPNLVTVTGNPTWDYDAGIKYRRRTD